MLPQISPTHSLHTLVLILICQQQSKLFATYQSIPVSVDEFFLNRPTPASFCFFQHCRLQRDSNSYRLTRRWARSSLDHDLPPTQNNFSFYHESRKKTCCIFLNFLKTFHQRGRQFKLRKNFKDGIWKISLGSPTSSFSAEAICQILFGARSLHVRIMKARYSKDFSNETTKTLGLSKQPHLEPMQ